MNVSCARVCMIYLAMHSYVRVHMRRGVVWNRKLWQGGGVHGTVWYGVGEYGVLRCGIVWHGVVWESVQE